MTTQGDFIAMIDVLTELANDSDSLSADEAIAALEALGHLISEAKRCESLVTTQVMRQLEDAKQPRQLGGRVYALAEDGNWRYHHDEIDREIVKRAVRDSVDPVTGEVSAHQAAQSAVRWMAGLYRAPASKPKQNSLKRLGFDDTPEIANWERKGMKLKVTDLEAPEGAG